MPIATTEQYAGMLAGAAAGGYALAGVNVSSSETLNAALHGFGKAQADGIIHVSIGGGEFPGTAVKDMVAGARAVAVFARVVGERCQVLVALHTDHCPPDKLDGFLRPLLADSLERRERGAQLLFHSQMFDGSTLPLEEYLAAELLDECACAHVVLEVECGVVGGEEDGLRAEALRAAVHDHRGAVARGRGAGHRRAWPLPAGRDVRQRPRRVRARQRQARPRVLTDGQQALAQAHPRRSVPVRLPRGVGVESRRDRRGGVLRRGEEEHRLGHPVRVHAGLRRAHVGQQRRRAEGRHRACRSRRTTRAGGAARPRRRWPPGSRRPASSSLGGREPSAMSRNIAIVYSTGTDAVAQAFGDAAAGPAAQARVRGANRHPALACSDQSSLGATQERPGQVQRGRGWVAPGTTNAGRSG